jgi:hypothetical protein
MISQYTRRRLQTYLKPNSTRLSFRNLLGFKRTTSSFVIIRVPGRPSEYFRTLDREIRSDPVLVVSRTLHLAVRGQMDWAQNHYEFCPRVYFCLLQMHFVPPLPVNARISNPYQYHRGQVSELTYRIVAGSTTKSFTESPHPMYAPLFHGWVSGQIVIYSH